MLINKQIVVVWGWVHFYVLYGQECQTLIPLATSSFDIKSVNQITQEMHVVVECAKQCIQGAQERSRFYAIKKRSLRDFELGERYFSK